MSKEMNEVKRREMEMITYSLSALQEFFTDDAITDIWVDINGKVSYKKFGGERTDADIIIEAQQVRNILVQISKHTGISIKYEEYPVFEGTIPIHEARITGIFPPWVSTPTITIRKPPKIIYSLEDYLKDKRITKDKYETIVECIRIKKNILVTGGTNTGKTTFTNAILKKMEEFTPNDSFYVVEDTAELQCKAKYYTPIKIKTEDAGKAVKLALRCSPNRIVFGEIRDGSVLWSLLDAWNTGHPGGVATLHASSAEGAFLRMRMLLSQCFKTIPPVNQLIDLIVHLVRDEKVGIKINEVITTSDYSSAQIEEIANQAIEASSIESIE